MLYILEGQVPGVAGSATKQTGTVNVGVMRDPHGSSWGRLAWGTGSEARLKTGTVRKASGAGWQGRCCGTGQNLDIDSFGGGVPLQPGDTIHTSVFSHWACLPALGPEWKRQHRSTQAKLPACLLRACRINL